ncbi:NADH dehydrogenase subunit 5 (mitochondrion) [Pan paniscus]|uniref:NADH-ubiquinone oxidoreductase chain 5 n=3 Tax=Pan paniscus TaxID=9597 RepID=NU5M_PANPA|nr:NADH dehydrogenase subunit 5 [Pan paniscus]P03916.2 RecName: Full=NADH-ubiquinone oxidoreductase chain 5; AltName: Full=NADH dehydrogenase subunit 5 [Pan paniscus]ADA55533.1 NADH dehydrogenase subunit 5 [Pan paniscus]ADA55559.1 NADH dehydrogenase subunit 5 [Pan paniscus]ADA55624.1 NADH dehydrogenase subunit 5 [Pan paniscus]ADA55650.1 NADH dehydrogenase subunit 5 [Pan paniscus]ADA55702.1 NADH dehydrogenase subunit 5 [Pan paniscus]
MTMYTTMTTLTLTPLILPILTTLINPNKKNSYPHYVKSIIASTFIISLFPTTMFMCLDQEAIISNWHWATTQTTQLSLSFKLDYFSMTFIPVALFVTWAIMEFSLWYMNSDPNINQFFKYLLIFLITMLILVTANNLFQLFIGWEGVGIMSFLLISWWYARTDANTAAIQAILYNRIGDIGFILALAWFLLHSNSWDPQQMVLLSTNPSLTPLLGFLLAAAGKSAQLGLHPWLPSAMEGPTPVSALLHSSTMVVAGVFLLIRFHPLAENNPLIQTLTLCLGAITTLFAAICALTQNDIKKIVAFSTSSQLGLMMVTIGINQPHLAFLHICTHAFFKAMLFMCSGSIIHNLNNEQDIRKMGGLLKTMPLTSTSLIIGSLALAGMPFLTGFYSKDLIIETANMSYMNAWALSITLIATSLTSAYSTRMILLTLMGQPRFPTLTNINENNPTLLNPIKRLTIGSLFAGFFITNNILPMSTSQMTIPLYLKLTALSVTFLGLLTALDLNYLTNKLKMKSPPYTFYFSNMLGFYPNIMHRSIPYLGLLTSQNLPLLLLDLTWLEKLLPKTISQYQVSASITTSTQKGMIKLYFLSFLFPLILTLLLIM